MENYLPASEGGEDGAAEKGVVRFCGEWGGKVETVNNSGSKSVLLTGMTREGAGGVVERGEEGVE